MGSKPAFGLEMTSESEPGFKSYPCHMLTVRPRTEPGRFHSLCLSFLTDEVKTLPSLGLWFGLNEIILIVPATQKSLDVVMPVMVLIPHVCLSGPEPSQILVPSLEALGVHLHLDISLACQTQRPPPTSAPFLSFFNFLKCFYLFWGERDRQRERERETEHEQGRGRERGRHRIRSRLQTLSCQHGTERGAQTHKP